MIRCSWEAKLGDKREFPYITLIRSHEGGGKKHFEKQSHTRMIGRTQKNYQAHQALWFNFYFLIDLGLATVPTAHNPPRKSGSCPTESHRKRGLEGDVRHVPEGGGRKFGHDPEGGTTCVASNRESTKSGYLTLGSGGMSKINFQNRLVLGVESIISTRGDTISDPSQEPTGSSDIPIPEESWKRLTCTPWLGESHPTRVTKRLSRPDS